MDFQGVDLRAVLRTFAEISGLNMVIDPDVQGTVDIMLTDVPWDQALDVILRGNQLDYTVDGTIVRIAQIKTLEDENRTRARRGASRVGWRRRACASETFPLSYAKAADIAPLLKERCAVDSAARADRRAHQHAHHRRPAGAVRHGDPQLLTTLDRAEPQVEIEARIVRRPATSRGPSACSGASTAA